jgi:excisionase family DNA binding protein
LLTTREVAEFLNVSPHTMLDWVSDGKIPAIRLANRAIRFREDELAEWLESKSTRG